MTDRVKGAYVSFDRDIRSDDVEHVLSAIRMMKYVSDVQCDDFVTDPDDYMNRDRIANEVLDVTSFVLRAALTDTVGYCADRPKVIAALEQMLQKLKGTKP